MGCKFCGLHTPEPKQQRQYRSTRRTYNGPQAERTRLRMVRATAHVKPKGSRIFKQASRFRSHAKTVPHRVCPDGARRIYRLRRTQRFFAARLRQGGSCRRKGKWRYRRQVPRSLDDCHPESFRCRRRLWRSRLERPGLTQRH